MGFFRDINTHISSSVSTVIIKSLCTSFSRGLGFKFEDSLSPIPTEFLLENGNSCQSRKNIDFFFERFTLESVLWEEYHWKTTLSSLEQTVLFDFCLWIMVESMSFACLKSMEYWIMSNESSLVCEGVFRAHFIFSFLYLVSYCFFSSSNSCRYFFYGTFNFNILILQIFKAICAQFLNLL